MPRAHRYFLPGHVWHITHRCHKKEFLLKFATDRRRWLQWLFKAKQRYGLCVLNYVVTSNHIHLLVMDTGNDVIARSLQLVAGRTAQEYNQRKHRKGAFWEDRYHATAIDTDEHFITCMVYIDLNMVRAGIVQHPAEWQHGGYQEIHSPPKRYRILDFHALMLLTGVNDIETFQKRHRQRVEEALTMETITREPAWTESLAVGSEDFVSKVQDWLGHKVQNRVISAAGDKFVLGEMPERYNEHFDDEIGSLSSNGHLLWSQN